MTRAMTSMPTRIATTRAPRTSDAVAELLDGLGPGPFSLVLLFASTRHDPAELAGRLSGRLDAPLTGCTTAGEIGPGGYLEGGVVAAGLGRVEGLRAHVFASEQARGIDLATFEHWRREFDRNREDPGTSLRGRGLGIVLADGLCGCEEHLVAGLYDRFQPLSLVGASAGDDVQYRGTTVFAGERALAGGLVFVVLETGPIPCRTFRLQDAEPVSEPLVITAARVNQRHVVEIEGRPAVEVFAGIAGVTPERLDERVLTGHSLMVTIGGEMYIRSVRRALPDGALELHSAIDEGVVVRVGRSEDTTASMSRFLEDLDRRGEHPDLALCFDCLHRRWELERQQRLGTASRLLSRLPVVGFTTYGEITDSLHVNQTMSGALLGGTLHRSGEE